MTSFEPTAWRMSTRCDGGGESVEVAMTAGAVGVRDSKDPSGPVLVYSTEAWCTFVNAVKRGDFDR